MALLPYNAIFKATHHTPAVIAQIAKHAASSATINAISLVISIFSLDGLRYQIP
jgi:hypothetical protein